MAKEIYVATIQVALDAGSAAEACDALSEGLPDIVLDWQYLPLGGVYLSPVYKLVNKPYREGDAFII